VNSGKKQIKRGSAFLPFSSPFYLYMVRGQTVATPRLKGVSTAPGWQIYTQISMRKEAKQSHAQVLLYIQEKKFMLKPQQYPYLDKRRKRRVKNIGTRNCAIKNTEYEVTFILIFILIYGTFLFFNSKSHPLRSRTE
jgi:hypothetical protein